MEAVQIQEVDLEIIKEILETPVNGLKEPIINTNDLAEENEQTEEIKRSEVNGESEIYPLEPSSKNIIENVEISSEESVAPEKEESSGEEIKKNDEISEKASEENAEDNQEHEEEEQEEAENINEEKEEFKSDKEDNESDDELPQSEKSQE